MILYSEYYAALLLTFCKHVKFVAFYDFFQLDYAYPLFSSALQYNTSLVCIDLSRNTTMCEEAISNIARALANNKTIEMVDFGDWISTKELGTFLNRFATSAASQVRFTKDSCGIFSISRRVADDLQTINCMQLLSAKAEYPFHVIKYVEAVPDGDDGFIPAHNVFYTGFDIQCHVAGLA